MKIISRIGVFGSVTCTGYLLGILTERSKRNASADLNVPRNFPGLPLYGSVSAATPVISNSNPVTVQEISPSSKSRVGQIMKYGFPSLDNVRSLDDYVLAYDKRNRVANWVFEHLTYERVKHNDAVDRSKCQFTEDTSIHDYFRSKNTDYKGSGFDRGHLAAAGNHRVCQKDVDQTFLLSNMAPQVGVGFNRDSWNRLEKHVRRLTRTYPNVYVCTGPLYLPKVEADGKSYVKYQVIGVNHVAVPTHFFKIVVMETSDNKLHMEAYVMPNQKIDDKTPLNVFLVPPESIERASGLLFFDRMSRSNLVQINGRKTTYV
ncbi:endonuclease G, mitochondrial-like isoform X1 [Homalodisca vitripennis]|uniref:Endonuclease n=1 Tax=Homalodisca liturata TaxID=320908 RepID=A0A1B6HR80_9HEMI|nr:endonuclease G, mitochondrial-like isoform X1 [Homalodisca vitripennis]